MFGERMRYYRKQKGLTQQELVYQILLKFKRM